MTRERLTKYLAEAFGTFCLVATATGAIVVQIPHLGISLVSGLIVTALIYTVGPVSGAHMNPAVSLAFFSVGRLPASELPFYLAAQLAGAVAASLTLKLIFGVEPTSLGLTLPAGAWQASFLLELAMTALLMFVILRVRGAAAAAVIGAVVALEAFFGGPTSGASMNPARSLGPALVSGRLELQWLYWAAPILGALLAAQVSKIALLTPPDTSNSIRS